jgi:hypothetical protein
MIPLDTRPGVTGCGADDLPQVPVPRTGAGCYARKCLFGGHPVAVAQLERQGSAVLQRAEASRIMSQV